MNLERRCSSILVDHIGETTYYYNDSTITTTQYIFLDPLFEFFFHLIL